MERNPYEIFQEKCPDLAESFNKLVEVQQSREGLDAKTKQLINIAIQTANANPSGVNYTPKWPEKEEPTEKKSKELWL